MAAAQVVQWGQREAVAPAITTAGIVWRLTQNTKYNGVISCLNTFWFAEDTGTATATGLLNDWNTYVVPTWKANVTNAMTFGSIEAYQVLPTESVLYSIALTGSGGIISLPAPCNSAGVVTWRTTGFGRNRRGRSFIAGLEYAAPSTSNGYQWIGTGVTRLNNIANAIYSRFRLGGNPAGIYMCVFSRKLYTDDPASWPNAVALMTGYTVQPYIATMGTRRYGRGM